MKLFHLALIGVCLMALPLTSKAQQYESPTYNQIQAEGYVPIGACGTASAIGVPPVIQVASGVGAGLYLCLSNSWTLVTPSGAGMAIAVSNLTQTDTSWACTVSANQGSTAVSGSLTVSGCSGSNSNGGTSGAAYFTLARASAAPNAQHCQFTHPGGAPVAIDALSSSSVTASGYVHVGDSLTYQCLGF